MKFKPDYYKPIKILGYFFIVVGICGFLLLILELNDIKSFETKFLLIVFGPVSFYHFIMGINLIKKNKWGLILYKGYLRLMYLGFPIGTFLAIKGLQYIKENNLEFYVK